MTLYQPRWRRVICIIFAYVSSVLALALSTQQQPSLVTQPRLQSMLASFANIGARWWDADADAGASTELRRSGEQATPPVSEQGQGGVLTSSAQSAQSHVFVSPSHNRVAASQGEQYGVAVSAAQYTTATTPQYVQGVQGEGALHDKPNGTAGYTPSLTRGNANVNGHGIPAASRYTQDTKGLTGMTGTVGTVGVDSHFKKSGASHAAPGAPSGAQPGVNWFESPAYGGVYTPSRHVKQDDVSGKRAPEKQTATATVRYTRGHGVDDESARSLASRQPGDGRSVGVGTAGMTGTAGTVEMAEPGHMRSVAQPGPGDVVGVGAWSPSDARGKKTNMQTTSVVSKTSDAHDVVDLPFTSSTSRPSTSQSPAPQPVPMPADQSARLVRQSSMNARFTRDGAPARESQPSRGSPPHGPTVKLIQPKGVMNGTFSKSVSDKDRPKEIASAVASKVAQINPTQRPTFVAAPKTIDLELDESTIWRATPRTRAGVSPPNQTPGATHMVDQAPGIARLLGVGLQPHPTPGRSRQ
jgi:hypothetical protein